MLELLGQRYGRIEPVVEISSAPADRFVLPDGTVFGIIASTTTPFCRTCDRSRLTADGMWYLCLYAQKGIDLRTPLREGAPGRTSSRSSRAAGHGGGIVARKSGRSWRRWACGPPDPNRRPPRGPPPRDAYEGG